MRPFNLSRRAVLRGTGVAMALPLMEAMLPVGKSVFAQSAQPPRFVGFFSSCGIIDTHFNMPVGPINTLSPTLTDWADLKTDFSQILGVASTKAGTGGDHSQGTQTWLRAASTGASVDQLAHVAHMAKADKTRFGSLAINVNGGCSAADGGAPSALCATSWINTTTYTNRDSSPSALFTKLFTGFTPGTPAPDTGAAAARRAMDESILTSVKDESRKLQLKLGAADKQVLEDYFTSIEALEARIKAIPIATGGAVSSCSNTMPAAQGTGRMQTVRAMEDLIVLALQCDLARYIVFMIENGGDYNVYNAEIGGNTLDHHNDSHGSNRALGSSLQRTERYFMGEMAYLVRKLKATKDPMGNPLLNSTAVIYGNEISHGNNHTHTNMPFLIAGSCNGFFKMGQTIQSGGNLGDVWIQLMGALGHTKPASIGTSTGRVPTEIMVG
jgi:hypothetical protein